MPGALFERLMMCFSTGSRSRGHSWCHDGRVRVLSRGAEGILGIVQGDALREVALEAVDGGVGLWCSCPYFENTGPCGHLWALILEAQRRGDLSIFRDDAVIEFLDGDPEGEEDWELDAFVVGSYARPAPRPLPTWRDQIARIPQAAASPAWPEKRQILYVVEAGESTARGHVVLSVRTQDRKKDGSFGRWAPLGIQRQQVATLPVAEDRAILGAVAGAGRSDSYAAYETSWYASREVGGKYLLRPPVGEMFPDIVRTGRCFLVAEDADSLLPLRWDEGGAWRFALRVWREAKRLCVEGVLRRGEEQVAVSAPACVTRDFVFLDGQAAPLSAESSYEWLAHMRRTERIEAPADDAVELVGTLACSAGAPPLELPEDLRIEEIRRVPVPCIRLLRKREVGNGTRLPVEVAFDYGSVRAAAEDRTRGYFDRDARLLLRRDMEAESAAMAVLEAGGVRRAGPFHDAPAAAWDIVASKVPRLTRELLNAGWEVEAEGKLFRRPGEFRMQVSSGIDWFELQATVEYGDQVAALPQLLAALRRGETMVRLGDGSYGMLPEEWLRRIGMVAGTGAADGTAIRFRPNQAGLLDALLAAQPGAQVDEGFARMREALGRFRGVEAAEQPAGFSGELRGYQREGLGWMEFLRGFGFGGCLADDMGVGKTAQVLALLEKRRELRAAGELEKPSLAVVPRSLVFNWREEAARFTPALRVLDYTGTGRTGARLTDYDLVLTTYGTLRRDITRLMKVPFDYVVLDEAQAVKNSSSESAKAVRLLQADQRLALSGTPVENHLGELWSLFEFLNPGMLGAAAVFQGAETERQMLAQALRPFILRRTKGQVARELPAKTEQTVYCELEGEQRKLYDELRRYYRESLLGRVAKEGLGKSKIQVLEALLRLRQAACHPGLIHKDRAGESSAKLEALLEELREVLAAGHKALVFSQFTSMLAIVRQRLDADGVCYEYLDGRTRDRQARVDRFQNDEGCGLFLVSLKAGGLGLNLTAAEYVFLLDPWWNPAVEAQAVDRAHRIGQTRPVFAYRLIARDTVEEKVLELQKSKRALADAIIGEDNALIRDLRREDLELLLS